MKRPKRNKTLVLMPDNQRGDALVSINEKDGIQDGEVRIVTATMVNGQTMPDYTDALRPNELPRPTVGPFVYQGRVYRPESKD